MAMWRPVAALVLCLSRCTGATTVMAPLPPPPAHTTVDATTLAGKLMFGYQGWFDTPGSGAPGGAADRHGWVHWSPGVSPNATNCTFDVWPAVDELGGTTRLTPDLTSRTQPRHPLALFSSYSNSTATTHFRWMREYGLDGVFVQRFVNGIRPGSAEREKKDGVLLHAIGAAEANGRVLTVMYDTSGASESQWDELILEDWKHLLNDLKVAASPAYLHHNGKPVLSVWGIGFTAHPGNPASSMKFLKALHAITPITFVGGVPTHWRESKGDSKPGYQQVYAAMDVLSPWLVGRYIDNAGFDSSMKNIFVADLNHAAQRGIGYAPVVFPGFSWSNLMRTTGAGPVIFNQIPRRGGAFWTHQAHGFSAMRAATAAQDNTSKPLFIYAAMFDEVDEGTAMMKAVSTLEETPAAPAQFVYMSVDGTSVPSDFYLSLAGNFTAQWRVQYHGINNECGAALAEECPEPLFPSTRRVSQCGACAGKGQGGDAHVALRRADCNAADVRAWCSMIAEGELELESMDTVSASSWSEGELGLARNEALQLTLQKVMARRVLWGAT